MNCNECEPLISPYLDDELDSGQARTVSEHLGECSACRNSVDTMRALTDCAEALPGVAPSTTTILKIGEAIRETSPVKRQATFGPVLDIDELIAYLHIDRDTLEIYLEGMPFFELGGKLLFRTESIDRWIQQREQLAGITTQNVSALTMVESEDSEGGVSWTL